jgi:hypothetical protein
MAATIRREINPVFLAAQQLPAKKLAKTILADFAWRAVPPCNLDPERLGGSLPAPAIFDIFHTFPFDK